VPSTPNPESGPETGKSPQPLPKSLADVRPFVIAGTGIWFLAFCVFLVVRYANLGEPGVLLWTSLAGWVLGLMGLSIMWWQHTAARRRTPE
jgi:hypothetical protein